MKQLLNENKLVTASLQKWFTNKMAENTASSNLSQELKDTFTSQMISVDALANIIIVNPRYLFDFFDEYEIYILPIMIGGYFSATINGEPLSGAIEGKSFIKRKDAEEKAVEEAFPLLEQNMDTDEREEE